MGFNEFEVKDGNHILSISNSKGKILAEVSKKLRDYSDHSFDESVFKAYGLYGCVNFSKRSYLIFIEQILEAGKIKEFPVYEIKKIRVLKFRDEENLRDQERKSNAFKRFFQTNHELNEIQAIEKFFSLPGHYISEFPIYESKFDSHTSCFIFNKILLKNLEENFGSILSDLSVKSIHGYFASENIDDVQISLISKRSRHRAGVRFFRRGADDDGYVSNFVETVQYIKKGDFESSYVQIRGSIPLKWKHRVDLKYSPSYTIENSDEAFIKSDIRLTKIYKQVFYLNLIKNIEYEKEICTAYIKALKKNQKNFLHFDFEGNKLGSEISAVAILKDEIIDTINKYSVFFDKEQLGVIRTNCIDTLDRTNVTQFIIGNILLKRQLKLMGVEVDFRIESSFKEMWYNNGNVLSIQYSGTPSIKSQIIMSGKNNKKGFIRDILFSCKRYLINRFDHGEMQDSYDIITGNLEKVEKGKRKNLQLFLLILFLVNLFNLMSSFEKDLFEIIIGIFIVFSILIYFMVFFRFIISMPKIVC